MLVKTFFLTILIRKIIKKKILLQSSVDNQINNKEILPKSFWSKKNFFIDKMKENITQKRRSINLTFFTRKKKFLADMKTTE